MDVAGSGQVASSLASVTGGLRSDLQQRVEQQRFEEARRLAQQQSNKGNFLTDTLLPIAGLGLSLFSGGGPLSSLFSGQLSGGGGVGVGAKASGGAKYDFGF